MVVMDHTEDSVVSAVSAESEESVLESSVMAAQDHSVVVDSVD
jgi:hypothetical protein